VKDHDAKLRNFLDRCRNKGLKLNESKLQLRKDQVAFMGHLITADGLQLDHEKVSAIVGMPSPTDKQAVQRLLGMVN
jgi:basic membrane lipoprotein Med (substrate-binding protein (PBP1-ABC) superfamily)